MKRTIFDCWRCQHHDSNNPYGLDYCNAQNTRCSFAYDHCEDYKPEKVENYHHEQQEQQPRKTGLIGCYLIFVIAALIGCLLTGCTTTKYVTVPEVHEHWHHSTDTIHMTDSIIDHQTTTIREVDSATMARYGIQMKDMQRAWLIETNRLQRELSELRQSHTDTIHMRDSIPYPVEVVKEVAKPLTWWQQARMYVGGIVIFGLIIFAVVKIIQRKMTR